MIKKSYQYKEEEERLVKETSSFDENKMNENFKKVEELKKKFDKLDEMITQKIYLFDKLSKSVELENELYELNISKSKIESGKESLLKLKNNYMSKLIVSMKNTVEVSDKYLAIIFIITLLTIPFQTVATTFGLNVPIPYRQTGDLTPFAIITTCCYIIAFIVVVIPLIFMVCFEKK